MRKRRERNDMPWKMAFDVRAWPSAHDTIIAMFSEGRLWSDNELEEGRSEGYCEFIKGKKPRNHRGATVESESPKFDWGCEMSDAKICAVRGMRNIHDAHNAAHNNKKKRRR